MVVYDLKVSIISINIMNVQDSLDNLSALHFNQQRSLLAQVKQKYVIALQKLQSAETREIGISELRKIVDNYRQPDHLRNYIAILKALKPSPNSATKEHQILAISILATTFKNQLLDPVDKPPSILKTTFRLVQILHGYFPDRSPTVQQACARALLDLSSCCLVNQQTETIFSIIYSPLVSLLKSGVDKASQATAGACLSELINNCRRVDNKEMLDKISPQLLAVILKVNCEYHQLFQAVSSMMEVKGLAFLQNKMIVFLAKILSIISGTRQTPNSGNLNSYMCKVHVCKIIERLGLLLSSSEKDKLADMNILEALVLASRNRIIQVQLAASRAIRAWKGQAIVSPPKNGLTSLEEKRNNKLRERSRSKEQTEKLQKQLTYMKEDLQKLVKGGWGANNRAKNYVKRGSGVGGGSHGKSQLSPPNKSGGKSHKEHFQQLREYIKKGAEQNKNIDRFASANLQAKQRAKSPPLQPKQKKELKGQRQINEPQLQIDEGDQMVYQPIKKVPSNKHRNSNILKDVGISSDEANDLIKHEKTLMADQKNNKFYTQKSRKDSRESDKDSLEQQVPKRKSNKETIPTKYDNFQIPLAPNKQVTNVKRQQPEVKNDRILSQEQIGDLVQEYNLSQVSQNLDGVLNESDLHMIQDTTPNHSVDNGKSAIQQIKDKLAEKKTRQSIVDKFFKKDTKEIEQTSKEVTPRISQVVVDQPLLNEPIANSLNFTQSLQSRNRSREEIQFTLNPKDRFNSIRPQSKPQQKQIQQQIVMSEYQQSIPKGQKLPIIKEIKQSKQTKQPKQPAPQSEIEYQQIIKNPPKRQTQSIKSRSEKGETEYNSPMEDPIDLGKQWISILNLMEKGEINQAFQAALALDDPIYLLRLMLISKSPLKKLTASTVQTLWAKFMEIYSHRFIDVLTVGVLGEAQELGLLNRCLSLEQLQDALIGLYELSGLTKGRLSYTAASLYNSIEKSLHPE